MEVLWALTVRKKDEKKSVVLSDVDLGGGDGDLTVVDGFGSSSEYISLVQPILSLPFPSLLPLLPSLSLFLT